MRDSFPRRRIAGITLMEMMVVVTIMGLLFFLLAGVVGKARERARTAYCLSNLRQLGIAMGLYTTENNQYVPPRGVDGIYLANPTQWPGLPGYPSKPGAWSDQSILGQYVGSTNGDNGNPQYFNQLVKKHTPLICPSDQYHIETANGIYGSYGMGMNFAWATYNVNVRDGYARLWKLSSIAAPGREFVLADGADASISPGAYSEPYPFPGTEDSVTDRTFGLGPNNIQNWAKRHNGGGANVLFLDGHANFYQDLKIPYQNRDLKMSLMDNN